MTASGNLSRWRMGDEMKSRCSFLKSDRVAQKTLSISSRVTSDYSIKEAP
jgi:hypothetical protein